jgi:hypothetical protein
MTTRAKGIPAKIFYLESLFWLEPLPGNAPDHLLVGSVSASENDF